jgi:hypothetical protein
MGWTNDGNNSANHGKNRLEVLMLYIIALIIVLLFILIWWGSRPFYHRNVKSEEFERFLRGFVDQGADGSLMFIDHQDSERFVQFAKNCSDQRQTILHFGFPDAPWSREYLDPLAKKFQTLGIDFKITTGEGLIHRFLEIDLEKEDLENKISEGAHIARATFEVMGLDESARYRIYFKGGISKEAARPSLEALSDAPNKLVRRLSRHYLKKINSKKN